MIVWSLFSSAWRSAGERQKSACKVLTTVVCPDAAVKLFVTASPEARAKRRHAELAGRGEAASLAAVRADLARRDARDRERSASPLAPAADAHLLDTTKMDIEAAVQAARTIVAACMKD